MGGGSAKGVKHHRRRLGTGARVAVAYDQAAAQL